LRTRPPKPPLVFVGAITLFFQAQLLSRRFRMILIYQQEVEGEPRYVCYGETNIGRLLAVVMRERKGRIRVVTAYDLDAGQKRDYLTRRLQES
jgi:uncharacterized DUF497 family protein